MPRFAVPAGSVLLPLAELGTAVALVLRPSARWGAVAGLGLLVMFMAGIARLMARGEAPACSCFGTLFSGPVGRRTLIRDVLLAVPAVFVVAYGAGEGVDQWVSGHSVAEFVAVLAVLCAAVLAVLLVRLWQENRRLNVDIDIRRDADALFPPGLPVGAPAPYFALPTPDGETIDLVTLLERGKPLALVFISPGSSPLYEDLARWQKTLADRVTIVLFSGGSMRESRTMAERYGLKFVLVHQGRQLDKAFRARAAPAVVMVAPDGRIASRTYFTGMMTEAVIRRALHTDYHRPGLRVVTVNGDGATEAFRETEAPAGQYEPA